MEILAINIAVRPTSRVKIFPIGLGHILTAVKRAGYSFDLLDLDAYRPSESEIDVSLQAKQYDVICFGCVVTGYTLVKNLAAKIRKLQPHACLVVGNTVASSVPELLLTRTEADIAVMGEGDETIVDLLATLEKGGPLADVAGICYLQDGVFRATSPRPAIRDLDSLPWLDFSTLDFEVYIDNAKAQAPEPTPIPREKIRALPINTARGCIARCTFCYHAFQGYPYRRRSISSVLGEISQMQERYGVNAISFSDELTFYKKDQIRQFCLAIQDAGLKFFWACECRAGLLDKEEDISLIELMRESGCTSAFFSLESAEPEILRAMNKNISTEQFVRQAELFHRAGMPVHTSLVFGYPQETPETIERTFDVCIQAGIYPSSGYLLPQPGTVMYDYARQNGFIPDEEAYLLALGDRQDLRLNLTKMSDAEFSAHVLQGAKRCSEALGLGLSDETLIKTQFYRAPKKPATGSVGA